MDKNNFITFKFLSSIYIKLKRIRLNSFDSRIQSLHKQIETGKITLQENRQSLDGLTAENILIKKDFYSITKLFENENKTISIKNNNYNVDLWENVFIKKESSYYVIKAKNAGVIYVFNENMNNSLDYFIVQDYSMVIFSVDKYRIILQFRVLSPQTL